MNTFRFVILNILFALNLQTTILIMAFAIFSFLCVDAAFWGLIVAFILLLLINYFFKIIIFPIVYMLSEHNHFKCFEFFNKLINNKNYRNRILVFVSILDLVIWFLYYFQFEEYGFLFQLLAGGGVLTSYLSFFIWYKFYNSKYKKLLLNMHKVLIDVLIISLLLLIILFSYTYHYAHSWSL